MRGRPTAPVEQRIAKGRVTKKQQLELLQTLPPRVDGLPQPPGWLDGYALQGWERFSELLFTRGQLSAETETSLLALAMCYEDWVKLKLDIRANGHVQVVTTDNGPIERIRPASQAFGDADRRLRYWLTEFGLTDASRGKVAVKDAAESAEDDPLARYGLN